jgi:hypothetical protein
MANNRKRKTIIEEVLPDTDVNQSDNSTDASDIIIVMSKVYKSNNGTKSFCMQSSEPIDEVYLQSQYPNGGKFIVFEYNQLNQLLNTAHYDIEPKPMTAITNNGNGASPYDVQIRMLFDELQFTRQMLMQQLQNNSKGNNGGSISELVGALAGLHALAPGGKDPIDLLVKGMELGQKNSGATDWKTEVLSTIKEIAPSAIQAFTVTQQRQPNGNGQPPMITASPDELLKQGLQWIKPQIIAGMDVDLAVSWLIQNANDPQGQRLLSMAIQGTIDNFIAIDTEIANEPYRTWFTNAIAAIKEWYAEQQQSEIGNDMDGRTGNDTNVTVNETVSVRKPKLSKTV